MEVGFPLAGTQGVYANLQTWGFKKRIREKPFIFRAFMALKHGQMHTILILLTIKQSNIIDFYGLFTATKIFIN